MPSIVNQLTRCLQTTQAKSQQQGARTAPCRTRAKTAYRECGRLSNSTALKPFLGWQLYVSRPHGLYL